MKVGDQAIWTNGHRRYRVTIEGFHADGDLVFFSRNDGYRFDDTICGPYGFSGCGGALPEHLTLIVPAEPEALVEWLLS